MAINQPNISGDQTDNAWKLEVTNQVNTEEARVNALVSRIAQLESRMGVPTGSTQDERAFIDADYSRATGDLLFTRRDTTIDNLPLAEAISGISAIVTGTIKAQVFSTTDRDITDLPRATGNTPTPAQRVAVFDPISNPATTVPGLAIAASALPPNTSWLVTAFTTDTATAANNLFYVGFMIRPGAFQATSIIQSFSRRGINIGIFANQVPEVYVDSNAPGDATRNLIVTTIALHNATGITRN